MHVARARLTRLRRRVKDSIAAIAAVKGNAGLRRALLSFGAAWTAEWAFTVALGVVAFHSGGASAVGFVAFLRMAPSAMLAPVSSALADRFRRDRVLMSASFVRGTALATAALLLAGEAPIAAVYACAVVASAAFIVFRPAHSALLPSLCTTPLEFTSANVVRGLLDSLSTLLGPLAAALLLVLTNSFGALAFAAGLSLLSGAALLRLRYEALPANTTLSLRRAILETGAGFRALTRQRDLRVLIGLALVQTFTRGCLTVFLVVVPFQVLETGETGVGLLTAAVGAGAVAGSIAALLVVGGRHLAVIEGVGVALWGLPLALAGALPLLPALLMLMGIIGIGNALVDVGLFTLPARLTQYQLLGRVFGALESLIGITVALGSLITPVVIAWIGVRGALAAVGLIAPALVALAWRRLRAIDGSMVHRDDDVATLQKVAMLRPLPMPAIDSLATHVGRAYVDAGNAVFRQGDQGENFYVIEAGEADIIGDGRVVRTLGPGDCFGEIALLRETPRTATVQARTALRLRTLARSEFIRSVSGFSASAREADELLRDRLATFSPRRAGKTR